MLIPDRLNGYDIIAVSSRFTPHGPDDTLTLIQGEAVIFGCDPTRRTGKYVTALIPLTAGKPAPPVTEWFYGAYFEHRAEATASFIARAGTGSPQPTTTS